MKDSDSDDFGNDTYNGRKFNKLSETEFEAMKSRKNYNSDREWIN